MLVDLFILAAHVADAPVARGAAARSGGPIAWREALTAGAARACHLAT
jgi:hypothetical protein